MIAAALIFAVGSLCPVAGQDRPRREAVLLDIEGTIGPVIATYLHQGIEAAARDGAALVILRIDTPGGLETAMRDIVRDILAAPVPVIAYVSPSGARAASAGTYILYASHIAAMAPGTNLGAATPVDLGGGRQPFGGPGEGGGGDKATPAPKDAHTAKAVNDAVAYIRSLATLRGRNAGWAERAVREAASLSADEALAQGVIDIVAGDTQDLLRQANGRSVGIGQDKVTLSTTALAVREMAPHARTRFLATITEPNIAYLLMLLGLYGLIFEFVSPGAIAPGVIGAIALLIGLFALNLLPVSYAGAALLLLGIALMLGEAFVPFSGVLGIGGVTAFIIGSIFLFDDEVSGISLSWPVVAAAAAASSLLFFIVIGAAWRAHRRRVVTGDTALVGETGQVLAWSGLEGQVHVQGERWRARAAMPLMPGQGVRVIARQGLTLVVEAGTTGAPQR